MTPEEFIERWANSGGAESSNSQLFISELCVMLGLPPPEPAREETAQNEYVFERSVTFKHRDGSTSHGRIDCYKRNCFVLEAKQSGKRKKLRQRDEETLDLLGEDHGKVKTGTALRGTRGWDVAMLNARRQAEDYARALPREHGWPPFIIVVDVGHCIELYADFSRQGKNYAQFPDRRSFRIMLDDLAKEEIRERLKLVWTDPLSLDPTKRSAEVTRDVAERLARIARSLEKKHKPEEVALFLMRCLFTMFAEDVELLPKDAFTELIGRLRMEPGKFPRMVEQLWRAMDKGDFAYALESDVRKFNGALFADCRALELNSDQLNELYIAAKRDWRDVEPAIFGTLLERALDPAERRKLGAHYTPRAYVERLVAPTIIEPLTEEWENVQAETEKLMRDGRKDKAVKAVRDFHAKLCATRVLDPACGTGNFLYVSMELMKRLEGEVLDYLGRLDEEQLMLEMAGHTVDPHQFLGLEINPRAVAIAELVLWLGFLKWQIKTGVEIAEPILKKFDPPNIRHQDAVLAYDEKVLRRDEHGRPVTRWDGKTMKQHPVTGEDVPDEDARIELYDYTNPRPAEWPQADYIVGNPPYIGTRRLRTELGDDYVDALRQSYATVAETSDLVMYWWFKAATLVSSGKAKRFGLITTNSIVQDYSRGVMTNFVKGTSPKIKLAFAVTNHPWVENKDGAAVRVAMTVGLPAKADLKEIQLGIIQGKEFETRLVDRINDRLISAADTSSCKSLLSNSGLCFQGVVPAGDGFKFNAKEYQAVKQQLNEFELKIVKPYIIGRDITQVENIKYIIDAFGLSKSEFQEQSPYLFQLLSDRVYPVRRQNKRNSYREKWWIFAEPRPAMRQALNGLTKYVGTPYTSKHRIFEFVDGSKLPDAMVYAIPSDDAFVFGCLSSAPHQVWCQVQSGTLETRPRYNSEFTFDPFPFPDPPEDLKEKIRALGERLDAFRKERQAEHKDLTMTAMYNVLERLREFDASRRAPSSPIHGGGVRDADGGGDANAAKTPSVASGDTSPASGGGSGRHSGSVNEPKPLTDKEKRIHEQGLISTLKQIHDELDAAVFEAYGWPADLSDEEILERLVALNHERAEEERKGHVRWLRPDLQAPKTKTKDAEQIEADVSVPAAAKAKAKKPSFPTTDGAKQIRELRAILASADKPISVPDIAARFRKTKDLEKKLSAVLDVFVDIGQAREEDGRYFLAD